MTHGYGPGKHGAIADRARRLPVLQVESAAAMSTCANAMVALALPWLVLENTGNAADAGVVGAATALPTLASALFAGTLVDLVGRRRTAVVADILSTVSIAAIPFTVEFFGFSVGGLVVLAVAGSAFDLAGITARKAMLPTVAAAAHWRLERATGVSSTVKGVALTVGPGLGGVLISVGGAPAALAVAAAASLLAAVLTAGLRLPPALPANEPGEGVSERALRREVVVGLATVWRDPLLRAVALLGGALFMVYLPIAGIVLPYYFHQQGAPQRFGLFTVSVTVGGVAGSLAYGVLGHRLRRRPTFVGAMAAAAGGLFAMAWLPPYPLLLVLAAFVGFAYGPISPLMNLVGQLRSTERTRGRTLAMMSSAAYAAGPVGYLAGGPLVQRFGPQDTFVLLASVLCVLVAAAARLPALRELDRLGANRSASGYESPSEIHREPHSETYSGLHRAN